MQMPIADPQSQIGNRKSKIPMTHFISIADFTPAAIRHFLDVAKRLKQQYKTTGRNDPLLAGKTLAMVFEKPSLRTRVSFAVAMTHLGGNGLLLRDDEVGLGKREPVADVARVLSGMCDGIMARTFDHANVTGLAKHATVPVINGLTDYNHPCQGHGRHAHARGTLRRPEEPHARLRGGWQQRHALARHRLRQARACASCAPRPPPTCCRPRTSTA
jgi:hypothetical protein